MNISETKRLFTESFTSWNRHNAPRLGAALAYYALLSLAPLVILLVGICGLVLSSRNAEQQILTQTNQFAGPIAQSAVATLIHNTQHRGSGILATVIAFATLFFGASGVFVELRNSLNAIWDVPPSAASGVHGMVMERVVSFAMVLGLGIFLLVTLGVSAIFGVMAHFASRLLPLPAVTAELLNIAVSVVTLSILFASVYKFVPNNRIRWSDVAVGAVATAVLFTAGRFLLSLYLTTAGVGSAYGAAGSLIALVVWVYYSAQIFFFGAVLTHVYAARHGSPAVLPENAPGQSRHAAAG